MVRPEGEQTQAWREEEQLDGRAWREVLSMQIQRVERGPES